MRGGRDYDFRMTEKVLIEKVTFKQRSKGKRGGNLVYILGTENSRQKEQVKGLKVLICLEYLRKVKRLG